MRNKFAASLIFIGIVLASGAESSTLTMAELIVQGFGGLAIMWIGVKIYNFEGEEE